jgi:hypothetical protein
MSRLETLPFLRLEDLVPPSVETIIRLGGGGNYRVYYRSTKGVGGVCWELFLAEYSDGRWRMLHRIGEVANAYLVEIVRILPIGWCFVLREGEIPSLGERRPVGVDGRSRAMVDLLDRPIVCNLDVPPGTPLEEP